MINNRNEKYMDYLSEKFKKKLDVLLYSVGILTFIIIFLHEKVIKEICGIDIIWFAYLTMSCGFTIGGFYCLRGYKRNINKVTNMAMLITFFIGGSFCTLLSIWRIFVEFSKWFLV